MRDARSRTALAFPYTELQFRNQLNPHYTISACPEVVITIPSVIYANKNFFLIDTLNDKIQDLKSSGLIEFWKRKVFVKNYKKQKDLLPTPVINLTHLSGCFQFCVYCICVCLLVFIGEIISSKITRIRRNRILKI